MIVRCRAHDRKWFQSNVPHKYNKKISVRCVCERANFGFFCFLSYRFFGRATNWVSYSYIIYTLKISNLQLHQLIWEWINPVYIGYSWSNKFIWFWFMQIWKEWHVFIGSIDAISKFEYNLMTGKIKKISALQIFGNIYCTDLIYRLRKSRRNIWMDLCDIKTVRNREKLSFYLLLTISSEESSRINYYTGNMASSTLYQYLLVFCGMYWLIGNWNSDQWNWLKIGKFSSVAANIITVAYGTAVGWTSAALLVLESDESPLETGPLRMSEIAWVAAIFGVGGTIGTLVAGWTCETFGRKPTLLASGIPMAVRNSALFTLIHWITGSFISFSREQAGWLMILYAKNSWYLYTARFISGFSGSLAFVSIPFLVAEIAEDR